MIVTGESTGRQTDPDEVKATTDAVDLPVLIGSGITADNIQLYDTAYGFIVGSAIKQDGAWQNPIDEERARALVAAFNEPGGNQTSPAL